MSLPPPDGISSIFLLFCFFVGHCKYCSEFAYVLHVFNNNRVVNRHRMMTKARVKKSDTRSLISCVCAANVVRWWPGVASPGGKK